ncbi:MAG: hypothetical protein GY948_23590 [Alphaproteobacteria bacterium]|nr:hypothetical protein [Alphaproteobacteria bacterium]
MLDPDKPAERRNHAHLLEQSRARLKAGSAANPLTVTVTSENQGGFHNKISTELRGTQDLRGFMGLEKSIPTGFVQVEGDVTIESPASDEALAALQKTVDAHCPVLDDLMRPVPVSLNLRAKNA